MSESRIVTVDVGGGIINKAIDWGSSRPTPTCLVEIGCWDARSMHAAEKLDDIVALDSACRTGTSSSFTCPRPDIIGSMR